MRLAWLHNRSDVLVSLALAAVGVPMLATSNPLFDPLVALLVAAWIAFGTVREVRASANELLWPDDFTCLHEDPAREPRA